MSLTHFCNTCKRMLDNPFDKATENCGGDCARCKAVAGDFECMRKMRYLEPTNPRWQVKGVGDSDATNKLSENMQRLAQGIDQTLEMLAGKRVAFVLLLTVDGVLQHTHNMEKADVLDLCNSMIEHYKADLPDIPAHLNPNLNPDVTKH